MSSPALAPIPVVRAAPPAPGAVARLRAAVRADWAVFGVILTAASFHFATIRAHHNWGGDFSQYIAHAQNIVQGRPYRDTGYIYNPAYPRLGPATYPPVFPLLLAPVVKIWGLHYAPMKAEVAAFFIGALVLVYLNFRRELPRFHRACLVAMLAFSPYFWEFRDSVISDIPFLFFVCATILVIGANRGRGIARAIAIAALIYVCVQLRSAGIALIPLLPAYDLLRRRFPGVFSLSVAFLSSAAVLAQSLFFLKGSTTYLDQLKAGDWPSVVASNLVFYAAVPNVLWRNGHSIGVAWVVYVILTAVALAGLIARVRARGLTLWDAYAPLHLGILLLWPTERGLRFLIPLVPLYFLYVCAGMAALQARLAGLWRSAVPAALLASICVSYAAAYAVLDFGPVRSGPEDPAYSGICDYLKRSAARDDIVLCDNPRVLALYSGRKAATYEETRDPSVLWRYCRRLGIRYVLVDAGVARDRLFLEPFVEAYRSSVEPAHSAGEFTLYRLK